MAQSMVDFDGFGVKGKVLPEHVEKYGARWSEIGSAIVLDKKPSKTANSKAKSAAKVISEVTGRRAEQYIEMADELLYFGGKYTEHTEPINLFLTACEMLNGIKRSAISTRASRIREERNPALKTARMEDAAEKALEKAKELVAEKSPEVTLPDPIKAPVESTFSVIENLWDGLVNRSNAGDAEVMPKLDLVNFVLDVANMLDDEQLVNVADAIGAIQAQRLVAEAVKTA